MGLGGCVGSLKRVSRLEWIQCDADSVADADGHAVGCAVDTLNAAQHPTESISAVCQSPICTFEGYHRLLPKEGCLIVVLDYLAALSLGSPV